MKRRLVVMAATSGLVAMFACGGDSDTQATASSGGGGASAKTVVVKDIAFKPDKLSIEQGDTVTWKFEDKGIPHNVIADDGSFKSENKDAGTFEHTFEAAGSFEYLCTIHPDTMKATVEVS